MPFIEDYCFGHIRIAGRSYRNDVKIIGGVVVPEWWRARGHVFDVPDVSDILATYPAVLVCGTGSSGMVRLAPALENRLAAQGITLHASPTATAVDLFNRLYAGGETIAGAFHLTC